MRNGSMLWSQAGLNWTTMKILASFITNEKQPTGGLENTFESSKYVVWKTVLFL